MDPRSGSKDQHCDLLHAPTGRAGSRKLWIGDHMHTKVKMKDTSGFLRKVSSFIFYVTTAIYRYS